jgi:hypothetical protein
MPGTCGPQAMQRLLRTARATTSDPARGRLNVIPDAQGRGWKLGFQLTGEKSEGQTVGVLDLTNA